MQLREGITSLTSLDSFSMNEWPKRLSTSLDAYQKRDDGECMDLLPLLQEGGASPSQEVSCSTHGCVFS